nr:class I SAM-dependent methyltransferase [Nocardia albiluteola]
MPEDRVLAPEDTAVRVALWRALHTLVDPAPHVLEDDIGLRLVDPADGWRERGTWIPRPPHRCAPGSWRGRGSSRI